MAAPPILLAAWARGGKGSLHGSGKPSPASLQQALPASPSLRSALVSGYTMALLTVTLTLSGQIFQLSGFIQQERAPWQWGLTHRSCPTPPGVTAVGSPIYFPDCAVRRSDCV